MSGTEPVDDVRDCLVGRVGEGLLCGARTSVSRSLSTSTPSELLKATYTVFDTSSSRAVQPRLNQVDKARARHGRPLLFFSHSSHVKLVSSLSWTSVQSAFSKYLCISFRARFLSSLSVGRLTVSHQIPWQSLSLAKPLKYSARHLLTFPYVFRPTPVPSDQTWEVAMYFPAVVGSGGSVSDQTELS